MAHRGGRSMMTGARFTEVEDVGGPRSGGLVPKGGSGRDAGTDLHRINMTELKSRVQDFRAHADTRIQDLPTSVREAFISFKKLMTAIAGTDLYVNVYAMKESIFNNLKTVRPGTMGEYFVGCKVGIQFQGGHTCAASCVGMMAPPDMSSCDQFVYSFDGRLLELKSTPDDKCNKAVIHVVDGPAYRGFTSSHVSTLTAAGIEVVSLNLIDPDGKYSTKLNGRPIADLPMADNASHPHPHPPHPPTPPTPPASTSSWAWIFGLILLILFIFFIIWIVARAAGGGNKNGYVNTRPGVMYT